MLFHGGKPRSGRPEDSWKKRAHLLQSCRALSTKNNEPGGAVIVVRLGSTDAHHPTPRLRRDLERGVLASAPKKHWRVLH